MPEALPGSHKTSTFVVMDFNEEFAWPPKPRKRGNHLSLALEKLLEGPCRLAVVTRESERLQLALEFDSIFFCIEGVGAFARLACKTNRLCLPAHIGIATGEARVDIRPEHHPALHEAKWMASLVPEPAIFVAETTAMLARNLTLHPYGLEEYGDFYNVTLGETYRLFVLTHPQLPEFSKVDDERPRHNIPWQTDFFIGREEEVDQVIHLVDSHRTASLVGGSGVGKSLLAKRIGLELLDRLRDGVKYVDLAGAGDRQTVLARIFRSIGLPVQDVPGLNLDLLRKHFCQRSHLVILDGCDSCASLLSPIIDALLESRQVRLITTSILPLPATGLRPFLIEDLPIPHRANSIQELEGTDSSALFIDGIRRYRQGFPPEDSEVAAIVEICRRTNGNPLAIQLIARRLRHESLGQILDSLTEPTAKGGILNPAVASTLARLDARSREAIEHAAMFVDPWGPEELSEMQDVPARSLVDTLEGLLQLGIVETVEFRSSKPRFRLNPHFREATRTALHAEGRLEELREKHFLSFYSRVRDSIREISGENQRRHLDRLDSMRHDFEEALRYLIECRPDPSDFDEAMRASWPYWYKRNRLRSVISLASHALENCAPDDKVFQARLMMLQGIFLTKAGDSLEAVEKLETALVLALGTTDTKLKGQVLNNLGIAYWSDAQPEKALESYRGSITHAKKAEAKALEFAATAGACSAMIECGVLREAELMLKRMRSLSEGSQDGFDQWNCAIVTAELFCEMQEPHEADVHVNEAIDVAQHVGDVSMISRSLMWKARILYELRQPEEAARTLGLCLCLMARGEHGFNKANSARLIELEMRLARALSPAKLADLRIQGALQEPLI